MDLMHFDQTTLYFDDPLPPDVERLLQDAGTCYGNSDGHDEAETMLLRAYFLAPQQLMVLVALYRYYFYQHRLDDALRVADRALEVAGRRLSLPAQWQQLHPEHLGHAVLVSMGLLRFYLMVLKAAGYLHLRLGDTASGRAMLEKLCALDSHDRLGGKSLLDLVREEREAAA
jgi:tetratricopeptide (TPR) repeat protein